MSRQPTLPTGSRRGPSWLRRPLPLLIPLMVVAGFKCGMPDWDRRYPCDGADLWDPNVPLFLHFSIEGILPTRSPAFRRSIRLFTEAGDEVETFIASNGRKGDVVICPDGGLKAGAVYHWQVDEIDTTSNNTSRTERDYSMTGMRSFRTDTRSDNEPISSMAACVGVNSDVYSALRCDDEQDGQGDTGDTGL